MRSGRCGRHSAKELPSTSSLLRQYKRWEAGEVTPKEFYQPIIAETFGTVTHAMFPVAPKRDADADVLAVTGMDTLELVSRLQRSDLDQATLDGLRIMADRLCSEYPFMPSDQLLVEGRSWLRRVVSFQGQRLTLNQHREILTLAGWIALLIACVEYDSGDRQAAETTRKGALSLGTEADHAEIKAWAHEIRAWIDLTTGNYHGVVARGAHRHRGRSAPQRGHPALGARSESMGTHRGPQEYGSRARQGTQASRSHAIPRQPRPPLRRRPDEVRLLHDGLLPASRRGPSSRDPRQRGHPGEHRLRRNRARTHATRRSTHHPRSRGRPPGRPRAGNPPWHACSQRSA